MIAELRESLSTATAAGIEAGAIVLDPGLGGPIHKEKLHESDYTPWEGYEVAAWPAVTVLLGKVVVAGRVEVEFSPPLPILFFHCKEVLAARSCREAGREGQTLYVCLR